MPNSLITHPKMPKNFPPKPLPERWPSRVGKPVASPSGRARHPRLRSPSRGQERCRQKHQAHQERGGLHWTSVQVNKRSRNRSCGAKSEAAVTPGRVEVETIRDPKVPRAVGPAPTPIHAPRRPIVAPLTTCR